MVEISGYLTFGLLVAFPAWYYWDERASVGSVGLATGAALFPPLDLWLSTRFPDQVQHHGVPNVAFAFLNSLADKPHRVRPL
ncbi:MAG: hypothetical protein ACOCSD_07600 [Halolamina sp.]